MTDNLLQPEIHQNSLKNRFELAMDGAVAVLEYSLEGGKIIFSHTGVPPALEGRGIASRLARAGLEYARTRGLKVVSLCSFVLGYIRKHPEYADLLE